MATKTFSGVNGGYRSNGTSITLVSNKVLSSTNPVRINSITVTCGVGNAYGLLPYISDTTTGKSTQIGSYINSSGSTVNMLPDGGYFFYPSSNTTISSSKLTKYTYDGSEYYRLSGYAGNFVYADGASTTIYASVGGKNSSSTTVSNTVYADYKRCGTVGGDSTKIVYGVTVGSGSASKTLSFNPDTSEIAVGEAVDIKLYCTGNGLLCVPSGSTVTVNYTEVVVDDPDRGNATGTITFNTSGDYSTFTTTLPASTFYNYYDWEYVSFPESVPTISGSNQNYITSGYKYPSLQNIESATIDGSNYGGFSFCVYNGELYCHLSGPDAHVGIIVTYRALFPNSITVLEGGIYAHEIAITGSVTSYELSSAASPEFIAGYNTLVFPELSGWSLTVIPDNLPDSSIVKYATYTKIQNTTINISGLSNNYNVNYTTLEGAESSFTSNGTYTVEGTVTINRAYDNSFSENGTISYEDDNVINIEFRKYRDVNIFLVDTSKLIGMVPYTNTALITISYSNGISQSLQSPYWSGEHPMYLAVKGTTSNTNAPGVTITSVKIDGIEISNKSGITVTNSANYSIEGQSSGIFPDFKGFSGTITFVDGTPPDTITCNRYASNTLQGTVVIDITDDVTNYSYGANIVQGNERLQFPEISDWTLTTSPSNTSNVLEKNATYTYTGPWKAVIPYVYITGTGWVKYEDTRVYNSSTNTWEKYDWKVYS